MEKKEYHKPTTSTHLLNPLSLLADSGDTGASGGDVPFGVRRRSSRYSNFDEEDYDY